MKVANVYRTSFDEYIHFEIARQPGVIAAQITVDLAETLAQVDPGDAEWAVQPRVDDAVRHLLRNGCISEKVTPDRVELYSNGGDPDPMRWFSDDCDLGFLRLEES